MNITIYSGSFNPVHFGHTGIARYVLEHTLTDELWLLVTPNNPLKDKSILADERLRYENAKRDFAPLNAELEKVVEKTAWLDDAALHDGNAGGEEAYHAVVHHRRRRDAGKRAVS